jgi:ferredoxin
MIGTRIIHKVIDKIGMINYERENNLVNKEGAISYIPSSPERGLFNPKIPGRSNRPPMSYRILPTFLRMMPSMRSNMRKTITSLDKNPESPRDTIEVSELEELETYAKSLGIGKIGFCQLEPRYIFQRKAVLYKNVIVLSQEMNYDRIETAPSPTCMIEVGETYNTLGIKSNQITDFLREKGFAAQAGHPLGGLTLYPPLAWKAGMGWHGINGIVIGPEFGPRHRLSAIYTSITNLPEALENEHQWVEEYCKNCLLCVEDCPGDAIFGEAKTLESGRKKYVDDDKCFPVFSTQHGCSVCIKVCPFNREDYYDLKKAFERNRS